jgi:hypothetical protein
MFESLSKLVPKKKDRIASGRNELKEALGEASPEMIEAFRAMTPEQKARGRLVGAIAEGAMRAGNEGVEDAFTEWEKEYNGGEPLSILHRCLALFQTVEAACDLTEQTYRGVRKIAVTMLMND